MAASEFDDPDRHEPCRLEFAGLTAGLEVQVREASQAHSHSPCNDGIAPGRRLPESGVPN